jgi:predicted amino acid-binding ACT domain protein
MTDRDSSFAALTVVAAQETTSGSSPVQFNVAHTASSPTGQSPGFDGISPPTAPDTLASETMRFQAFGAGFRLYAWTPETPSPAAQCTLATQPPDRDPASNLYHGSVLTKPMFARRPAQATEVLVSLGHEPWSPGYRDSLMLLRACRELTSVAARHRLPVRFLQSPVSPFRNPPPNYRADGSGEAPRVSNALAVRMALGTGISAQRLDTLIELTNLAERNGFGLDVSDQRLGRGKGQWWTVLHADPATYQRRRHELFGWAPTETPRSVLLCTAIGPGRLGSTAAITEELAARQVGVVAISAAKLHGITFVNLMIPLAPGQDAAACVGLVATIGDGLASVATRCGLTNPAAVRARSRIAASSAADCMLLTSGPFPLPPDARRPDLPLWTSWALPVDVFADQKLQPDLAELVIGRLARESAIIAGARIDYQRTRISPDRRLNSRAKITISLPSTIEQVPATLTELCTRVRRETLTTLVQQGIPVRGVELTLDWRERWVGQGPG